MSLLKELQHYIESIYGENSGVNLEEFVVGETRFTALDRQAGPESRELSDLARIFLRQQEGKLYMAIYFSRPVISLLERNDPRRGLSEHNIHPFIVFIEEVNHALHAAIKFLAGDREIKSEHFIRDLELLAKIDTYYILKCFLAYFNRSKQLENFDRLWLRYHLFERASFQYQNPKLSERYFETNRLGEKYIRYLDALPQQHRVDEMRRFRSLSYPVKARYISMLP
ncbi:MAG: hypothetical protein D6743_16395 [Calditrichaeota bacterium]|nr:MAG: hypothetical protein D6743_16395 [Calditrichota bacterium]